MIINRSRLENHSKDRILFFTHIPKCGGTSMMEFFGDIFGQRLLVAWTPEHHRMISSDPDAISRNFDCIVSHREFGDHLLLRRQVTYVSMVRDPLERAVSYYNYVRNRPDHFAHADAVGMSFSDFVAQRTEMGEGSFSSEQCKYLCGAKSFESAKQSCVDNYALVADLSEIDDFLGVLLETVSGGTASTVDTPKENVSRKTISVADVDQDTKEFLRRQLSDDIRLVDFVRTGVEFSSQ